MPLEKAKQTDNISQMERVRIIPQEVRVREILGQTGAVLNDHFRYASGRHGDTYINKDAIYPHTELASELCRYIAQKFQARNIDTVAGPQMGGVIIAQYVAKHLTEMDKRNVSAVFAEKEDDELKFKRGYDEFIRDKNVLAVEDILNTGGSAKKLIETIRENGGNVISLASLVNRGGVMPQDVGDVPLHSLLKLKLESFAPEDCNQCVLGIPINTKVGHSR